jgi:UDP-N-acetyl-D-mannosaminuronic acid dehydrogenase
MHHTQAGVAEMVKLVENSSRDVAIAFAHQVAQMAEKQGIEARTVIEFANKHPRVSILSPSCGVGGHCIALDPWFLIETFPEETVLLQAARAVNDARPEAIVKKITAAARAWKDHHKKDPTIVLLGATYKPNVDDLRESPALHIAHALSQTHASVYVCEPHVSDDILLQEHHVNPLEQEEALARADIIVGLVKHTAFSAITLSDIAHKEVYDYCGIWYTSHRGIHQVPTPQQTHNRKIIEEHRT